MGRAADTRDEEGPERTCAVTRVKRAPEDMVRFVIDPNGDVVADVARRLPGRGVWLTASRDIVIKAVAAKVFPRAFKGKAAVSAELADSVDSLLERDALQWLSLANKAGLIVAGFAKVEAAINRGGLAALIHASHAGADGVEKLGKAVRRASGEQRMGLPAIGIFNSGQLDLALGRPHVIHAALATGAIGQTLVARCRRLAAYRGLDWPEPVVEAGASLAGECAPETVSSELTRGQWTSGQLTNGHGPGIANE